MPDFINTTAWSVTTFVPPLSLGMEHGGLQTFMSDGPYSTRAVENNTNVRRQSNDAAIRVVANNATIRTVQDG